MKFVPMIWLETGEGQKIPRFYLPVRRCLDKLGYDCCFFLFAPFVLAWVIVSEMLMILWKDLVWFGKDLRDFRKAK